MRRALVLAVLVALLVAPAAQAHKYNNFQKGKTVRFAERVNDYRADHGRSWLIESWFLLVANTALNVDNYHSSKWTTKLEGVPWPQWNDLYLTPDQQVANLMMITRRCRGKPYTPRQALESLMRRQLYRHALLMPVMAWQGVRVTHTHRHQGAWKGRGSCMAYYLSVAS